MVDLHVHTTASDGVDTPSALIARAVAFEVKAIAITDHDTVRGVSDAQRVAAGHRIACIPGIELSVRHRPGHCHVLGLGLREPVSAIERDLAVQQDRRHERNRQILAKLDRIGIHIDYRDMLRKAAEEDVFGTVGRPHIAREVVRLGGAHDAQEAFNRFIGAGGTCYVPLPAMCMADTVEMIHRWGGKAVVAHPLSLKRSDGALGRFFRRAAEDGIDGIEVLHPSHSEETIAELRRLAEALGLLTTGGSDYHGSEPHGRRLGYAGRFEIPDELARPFVGR